MHLFYELSARIFAKFTGTVIQTFSKFPPASSYPPRLQRMPAVSIKEKEFIAAARSRPRARSLTNAREKEWRRFFLGEQAGPGLLVLSATRNIIKPRLFSLDFETSPSARLPFAAHDKLCMAEHFNGLVSFCV